MGIYVHMPTKNPKPAQRFEPARDKYLDMGRKRITKFVKDYWSWALVLALLFYLYRSVSPNIDLAAGEGAAPDFELAAFDGDTFRLSDHRGKVVVLNFWATWCPPCRAEIPGFVELQHEMRDEVVFVGISLDQDGPDGVRSFAEARGINYPVGIDNGRIAHLYGGISTLPTTLLVDQQGVVRYRHTGLLLKRALQKALEEMVD
jgi:peroxiredoxin